MKQIKPKQMVKILSEKLTREEFYQLFCLIDGDGLAGPFWERVAEKAEEFFPNEFNMVPEKPLKVKAPDWINPWEDAIPVPIEELAECHEGLDKLYGTMKPGERIFMSKERILEGWKQDADKLDAYILPQPSGYHFIGVRYGAKGSEYLSPPANQEKTRALLEKYSPGHLYNKS